jgi:microcystin-dependent protein
METVHKYRAAPPARARIAALLVPVALASGRLVHAQDALIIEGDKVTVNANLVVTGSITAPGLADVLAQLQALTDRLQSAEQVAVPVGSIMPYGGGKETAAQLEKNGWLFCDGRTVDRATYSELFAAIGIAFGSPTPDNPHSVCRISAAVLSEALTMASGGTRTPRTAFPRHLRETKATWWAQYRTMRFSHTFIVAVAASCAISALPDGRTTSCGQSTIQDHLLQDGLPRKPVPRTCMSIGS